ncbi:REP-associated tyrosine transposase [Wenzhouxiangella marina]|uniref:Transposase n=1 Tax=Wenzhouxiangella marina TaxID=1579979 RepID=A0A0K0XYR7_9GAMM|nr:transposase [Wenzhouxiangella marina]AKS42767.1 transposase [Wenzhouxiangella marina]MBB6087555.1 putative transposase [Wenzhouxiangella marina]
MPRYRRYFSPSDAVFLTIVTRDRAPWLRDARAKRLVIETLRDLRERHSFKHYGHVLLDDHMHWLIQCHSGRGISDLVRDMKLGVIHGYRRLGLPSRRLWQNRFYDHIIRHERDLHVHLDYIHYNPVKHGYVDRPSDYPWSSFQHWVDRGHYTPYWGESEPAAPGMMGEP